MMIERTVKYASTVPDLMRAWQFVMEHIEEVGEAPSITISPIWTLSMIEGVDDVLEFEVSVSGMVEE